MKCVISRSHVTLTFDRRSFKRFKLKKILLLTTYMPSLVKFGQSSQRLKNNLVLGQKHYFLALQYSYLTNPCIKLYWTELWHWSRVNDKFWLLLKVCICCGFCNHVWQRFLHFWGIFSFLERLITKQLLMQLKLMYLYQSYLLMSFSTFCL